MSWYDRVTWFPLCAGLAGVGLALAWLAWRRRGAAAGLRGAGWSLLPLAAYLTGVIKLLWQVGTALARWVAGFAFSPTVWAGVALGGLAAACLATAGLLRRRAPARGPGGTRAVTPSARGPALPPGGRGRRGGSSEFDEAEEILRRRGIT